MAFVAFRWDGAEVVLLQAWLLCPAWLLGRAAGTAPAGALAGLALVAGAVWTFELLPLWGVEAAVASRGAPPTEVAALALEFDREDIALASTHLIGALAGLGGALRLQPGEELAAVPAPPPAPPPPHSDWLPPAPLWARLEPPAPPPEDLATAPPPPATEPSRPGSVVPWAAALLVATLATDFFLDRLFDMYTRPQGLIALALLLAGLVVGGALARRYAIAMLLAGLILGSAFAAVQHAEYQARDREAAAVRR